MYSSVGDRTVRTGACFYAFGVQDSGVFKLGSSSQENVMVLTFESNDDCGELANGGWMTGLKMSLSPVGSVESPLKWLALLLHQPPDNASLVVGRKCSVISAAS